MEKLIKKGAEADIYLTIWYGLTAILKVRRPKSYMQPILDKKLREYRTLHEAFFLREARRLGVHTPFVYFVDPNRTEIVMEMLEGLRLKDILTEPQEFDIDTLCKVTGRNIARIHHNRLIHGDLTTSNFIVNREGEVSFIDFGLSFTSSRLEDRAVDIHLLKEVLTSAHSSIADRVLECILRGYSEVTGIDDVQRLVGKIREVERRGRYARVT